MTQTSFDVSTLRAISSTTQEVITAAVAGVTHPESVITSGSSENGLNWVLGHLVHVNDGIIMLMGGKGVLPQDATSRYAPSAPPVTVDSALPFEQLRDALHAQTPRLDAAWATVTPEQLQAPPPPGFSGMLYDFLGFITFHQAYHAGQCGLMRRQIGKDRAFG